MQSIIPLVRKVLKITPVFLLDVFITRSRGILLLNDHCCTQTRIITQGCAMHIYTNWDIGSASNNMRRVLSYLCSEYYSSRQTRIYKNTMALCVLLEEYYSCIWKKISTWTAIAETPAYWGILLTSVHVSIIPLVKQGLKITPGLYTSWMTTAGPGRGLLLKAVLCTFTPVEILVQHRINA